MQFGKDLIHRPYYFTKDKHTMQQIKQQLQFQILARKRHLTMM